MIAELLLCASYERALCLDYVAAYPGWCDSKGKEDNICNTLAHHTVRAALWQTSFAGSLLIALGRILTLQCRLEVSRTPFAMLDLWPSSPAGAGIDSIPRPCPATTISKAQDKGAQSVQKSCSSRTLWDVAGGQRAAPLVQQSSQCSISGSSLWTAQAKRADNGHIWTHSQPHSHRRELRRSISPVTTTIGLGKLGEPVYLH